MTLIEGSLSGRIALVTGASRGIGRAVATLFASHGAHVVAVARTQAGLEELDDEILEVSGQRATLAPIDLTDFDLIDHMGASVFERFGRLDILVGNAGLLTRLTPMAQIPPDQWQATLATNLTANWRLLRSFNPLLKVSEAGRAIFVTAAVGHDPTAYWGDYAVAKAGLEAMVKTYAAEIMKTNIRANLIDPGPTRTGLRTVAFPGENPDNLQTPAQAAEKFLQLALPSCQLNGQLID